MLCIEVMKVKEIIFFSAGDPESASSWSNVPCCFVRALREKGITVRTVQMCPSRLERIYNFGIRYLLDIPSLLLRRKRTLYFGFTSLYRWVANRGIKRAVKKYPHADYCFFIGYQLYNKHNDIPSLLLSDWSQAISLERKGKQVDSVWHRCAEAERRAITHARHVITIFPCCAEQMQERYPTANIHYLGGNVVNNLSGINLQNGSDEIIQRKKEAKKVLFIGKPDRYLDSARKVVEAVRLLQEKDPEIELNIIGITADRFSNLPPNVHCHGYLRKDNAEECRRYYDLLLSSKVIVNPTPKWAAYSSTIEAMYFYTPLIVSPYEDFVKDFGEDINFGLYNQEFTVACIAGNIEKILTHPDYATLSTNAHEAVDDYTWENYVEKVLKLIEK